MIEYKYVPIFSGDLSTELWKSINNAKSKKKLREALYLMGIHIQNVEVQLKTAFEKIEMLQRDLELRSKQSRRKVKNEK